MLLVAGAAAVASLQPVGVALVDSHQGASNALLLAKGTVEPAPGSRTCVVVFSRSGNTALMAQRIAQRLRARLLRLQAPDYPLGLAGWAHAMLDARNTHAQIIPAATDFRGDDTVYLGAPIWLYSPAPPIWQFVASNRFDGKHVVLFNSFNSRFKPEFISAFEARVLERGARSFEHRYVQRGRIGQQLSAEELLRAVDQRWPTTSAARQGFCRITCDV